MARPKTIVFTESEMKAAIQANTSAILSSVVSQILGCSVQPQSELGMVIMGLAGAANHHEQLSSKLQEEIGQERSLVISELINGALK